MKERLGEHERPQGPETQQDEPAAPLHELASNVGNRAFTSVAREAAGILPGGEVHPAVQSEINTSRGGGTGLDTGIQSRFSESLGEVVMAALGAGLKLQHFEEHMSADFDPRGTMLEPEEDGRYRVRVGPEVLPILFTLVAAKP